MEDWNQQGTGKERKELGTGDEILTKRRNAEKSSDNLIGTSITQ